MADVVHSWWLLSRGKAPLFACATAQAVAQAIAVLNRVTITCSIFRSFRRSRKYVQRTNLQAEFTAGHFEMSLRPVNRRFSGRSDMGIESVTSRNSGFAEKVAGTSSTSLWPRSLQNHVVSSYPSRTSSYPSNESVLRRTNSSGP